MSTNTPNFNLEKPNVEEFYDVGVQNANIDKIDTTLKTLTDVVADGVTQEDLTVIDTKLDDINQGVDEINVKSDQIKQGVDNISAQIANKNTGKVLKSKVFTSNGTFTVPAGVTEVYVTGGGAGGSGGAWGNQLTTTGNAGGVTSFGNLLSLPGGNGGATRLEGGIVSIVSLPGGPGGTAGKSSAENCNGGSSGYYAGGTGVNEVIPDSGRAGDGAYCAGGGGVVNGHGGGAGHFVIDRNLTVTSGTQYVITIGRGGAGVQGRHTSHPSSTYTSGKGGDGILTVKWWE